MKSISKLVLSFLFPLATLAADKNVVDTTKAEDSIKLVSELRIIPYPITDAKAKTTGGLGANEIAITIDDGPDPKATPEILATLKKYGVKATFFLVGHRVKKYPEMVKAILKDGHSVGNHTWDHANMPTLSSAKAIEQIESTQKALEDVAKEMQRSGETENAVIQPFFRFPYGAGASNAALQKILLDRGMSNFYWSMSAHDSRTQNPDVALKTSIEMINTFKKGIFLMHETHPAGLKMLPRFLEELKRRNYKTVYFQMQK